MQVSEQGEVCATTSSWRHPRLLSARAAACNKRSSSNSVTPVPESPFGNTTADILSYRVYTHP